MKNVKYYLVVVFAAQFIHAQSSIVIGTGASIDVGLGADICADIITGTVTGDGTQCSATIPKILNLVASIEGFYDGSSMVPDTVTIEFRNISSPYSLVEQKKLVLNSSGAGSSALTTVLNGTAYYLVVKHRNSIETWSGTGKSFTANQLSYDFTTASSQAYGNNMKLKSGKWCIYNGEVVNDDQFIDGDDVTYEFNSQGIMGYVYQDVTGDDFVDGDDVTLTFNNQGVGAVTPTVVTSTKRIHRIIERE